MSRFRRGKNPIPWFRCITALAGVWYIFMSWSYYVRIGIHEGNTKISYAVNHHNRTDFAYKNGSQKMVAPPRSSPFRNNSVTLYLMKHLQEFKTCPDEIASYPIFEKQEFLPLAWKQQKQYFFSAFYDEEKHEVRILGDMTGAGTSVLYCMLSFDSWPSTLLVKNSYVFSMAGKSTNNSNIWRTHKSYTCPVPAVLKGTAIPYAVKVGFSPCSSDAVQLVVIDNQPTVEGKLDFGVCIPPFSRNYSNVNELIEFIEANRIFGAQQFTFYNYSADPSIHPILESYVRDGIAKVIQWPLYPGGEDNVVYYGQVASMYDCLYRNRKLVNYLTFLDLDEVLVLRHPMYTSWSDIVKYSTSSFQTSGLWLFHCAFFRKDWPSYGPLLSNSTVTSLNVQTLLKVLRERKVWKMGKRSKYIIRPDSVTKLKVHVAALKHGLRREVVPPQIGLLHHYRDWGDTHVKLEKVMSEGEFDLHMMTYADKLIGAIQKRRSRLTK